MTAADAALKLFGGLRVYHGDVDVTGDGSLPQVDVPRNQLEKGIPAFELFVLAGLAASKGEARRLIRGGGARINDAAVTTEARIVSVQRDTVRPFSPFIKLSAGRKRHVLVRPV